MHEKKWEILAVSLTIAVLGFSTFGSTYSSFLHNSEMAEVNYQFYQQQANIISGQEHSIYQETADSWRELSVNYRNAAKLRAYSANLCFYSIILLLVGILITIWERKVFWRISFGFSVALIALAFFIFFIREEACPLLSIFRWPLGM